MKSRKKVNNRRGNEFPPRVAFTLVEMLMTVVVTLILMLSLINFFAWVGNVTRDGRAQIEMAGPLRGAALRLQNDLDMVTVPMRPWPTTDSAQGYFEYIEGPPPRVTGGSYLPESFTDSNGNGLYDPGEQFTDANFNGDYDYGNDNSANINGTNLPGNILGDINDVLMFTAHSYDEPFVGRVMINNGGNLTPTVMQSFDAEIIWWVQGLDFNQDGVIEHNERVLRRRALLILPGLGNTGQAPYTGTAPNIVSFFNSNDLSARIDPSSGNMIANSLADLSQRANRFAHDARVVGGAAPAFLAEVLPATLKSLIQSGATQGEDAILSGILAFDVRAYDPLVEVRLYNGEAMIPGDPGWSQTAAANKMGRGAYVDLNYTCYASNGATQSTFWTFPQPPLPLASGGPTWTNFTYDTWSFFYEQDGIDQDSVYNADQFINGLDDDSVNGVDDVGERETSPPYPFPLRGLQVKIRIYDLDTRQVRQNTVTATFRPE